MNFKELQVTINLEGDTEIIDIRKDLGNTIYQKTGDLGEVELAKKIYTSEGDIILTEEQKQIIQNYITPFKAMVKLAINQQLNG